MIIGKTERETIELNGWGVGDILEGDEGYGPQRILITAIGEEGFLCRWDRDCSGQYGEESGSATLRVREWKKIGADKRLHSGIAKRLLVEAMYSDSEGCACCDGQHRFATVLKDGPEIFDHAEMIQGFIGSLPNDSEVRISLSYTKPMPGAEVDREDLVKGDGYVRWSPHELLGLL